jgi:hypothetical protein
MATLSAELAEELKTLRKGRGVDVTQVSERIGPALREVCGLDTGESPADVRRKLGTRLEGLAAGLPDDLRVAVLAALGLHPGARLPFYKDRIRWIAQYLNRDERTARRRVDYGIGQLAEIANALVDAIGGGAEGVRFGWRVEELRSVLLLDQATPEAIELRRILAERDGLNELDLAFTLPRGSVAPDSARELDIDVLYGGTLLRRVDESAVRFGSVLRLPRRLERRETHEFGLRFRVPEDQVMRPHYACVSKHPHDYFDLRVRFDPARLPARIWRVENAFQRDLDDPTAKGESLTVDAAGEVRTCFRHLTPGLAYGVRWQDP